MEADVAKRLAALELAVTIVVGKLVPIVGIMAGKHIELVETMREEVEASFDAMAGATDPKDRDLLDTARVISQRILSARAT